MKLTLVGVNHQTAGVETRERLAVPAPALPERLLAAVASPEVAEALVVSTCNRSELYFVTPNGSPQPSPLEVFARVHQAPVELFSDHSYVLHEVEAASHIFKVAAGADSMVLGETEIMGQLRQAVECARETGTAGKVLSRMGDRALAVGKRIRTETKIDKGCMSVASVAADLARQIFDDLSSRRLLVLGAGEVGSLVARRMIDHGAHNVIIISRTRERAEAVAGEIGGQAAAFDEFVDELLVADIVICSTASPHPLVTVERVRAACGQNRPRPMLLIDLAMPRDVDPRVRDIGDVYLYDLDDLQAFVRSTEDQRLCELPLVESIAETEAGEFITWAKSQEVVPLILDIRQRAETIRDEEIGKLLEAVPDLPKKADKAIHLMSKRLVRRLLEQPLSQLRELAANGTSTQDLAVVRQLFGLDACLPADEQSAPEEGEGHG